MNNAPCTFVNYMNESFAKHIGKHVMCNWTTSSSKVPKSTTQWKSLSGCNTYQDNWLLENHWNICSTSCISPLVHISSSEGIKPNTEMWSHPPATSQRNDSEFRTFLVKIVYVKRFTHCSTLKAPLLASFMKEHQLWLGSFWVSSSASSRSSWYRPLHKNPYAQRQLPDVERRLRRSHRWRAPHPHRRRIPSRSIQERKITAGEWR